MQGRNADPMAARSRRGQSAEFTALDNPDREIKRMVAEAKELAADTIGPESEQTPRALEALTDLQEGALQAIEEGTGAAEVVAQLDESLEQFHSSLEDAEGGTYADIDTEAVDTAIEDLCRLLMRALHDDLVNFLQTSTAHGDQSYTLAASIGLAVERLLRPDDDTWNNVRAIETAA